MVPKVNRLRGEKNFKRLMRQGRSFFSPTLVLRIVSNNQPEPRFAFVVPAKAIKKAVDRNKLKRRAREIVRADLAHIKPGYDMLITMRKPALECTYQALRDQLLTMLMKTRMLRKDV